jgi:hypothetical protein
MNAPVVIVSVRMIKVVQTVILTLFIVTVFAGNNPQYDKKRLFKAKGSSVWSHCGIASSLNFFITFMCVFSSLRDLSPPNRKVVSTAINEEFVITVSMFRESGYL